MWHVPAFVPLGKKKTVPASILKFPDHDIYKSIAYFIIDDNKSSTYNNIKFCIKILLRCSVVGLIKMFIFRRPRKLRFLKYIAYQ